MILQTNGWASVSDDLMVVNSVETQVEFSNLAAKLFEEHKHLTWQMPRIGPDRSLNQNALFQKWARQFAAHILKKDEKEVTEGEHEGVKRWLKIKCWQSNRYDWMVFNIKNPETGEEKTDFRSTKRYKNFEMFQFLFFVQFEALGVGCRLEAEGEYKKNLTNQEGGD